MVPLKDFLGTLFRYALKFLKKLHFITFTVVKLFSNIHILIINLKKNPLDKLL